MKVFHEGIPHTPPVVTNLFQTNKSLQHSSPQAIRDLAQQDPPVQRSPEAVPTARILLQPFMPRKMKESLDGLGVHTDGRRFEHLVVSGDKVYGG